VGCKASCTHTDIILPIIRLRHESRTHAICPWNFEAIYITWTRLNAQWGKAQLRGPKIIDDIADAEEIRIQCGVRL
jgi:hypothetical protein